jgi:hypothetical protein
MNCLKGGDKTVDIRKLTKDRQSNAQQSKVLSFNKQQLNVQPLNKQQLNDQQLNTPQSNGSRPNAPRLKVPKSNLDNIIALQANIEKLNYGLNNLKINASLNEKVKEINIEIDENLSKISKLVILQNKSLTKPQTNSRTNPQTNSKNFILFELLSKQYKKENIIKLLKQKKDENKTDIITYYNDPKSPQSKSPQSKSLASNSPQSNSLASNSLASKKLNNLIKIIEKFPDGIITKDQIIDQIIQQHEEIVEDTSDKLIIDMEATKATIKLDAAAKLKLNSL